MIVYSLAQHGDPAVIAGWPKEPAPALAGLDRVYTKEQRVPDLVQLYDQTFATRDRRFGPDHPFVGVILERFALLEGYEGNYERAEQLYRRALTIKENRLGPNDPQVAESYRIYATLLRKIGRETEAIALETRVGPAPREMLPRFYSAPRPLDQLNK